MTRYWRNRVRFLNMENDILVTFTTGAYTDITMFSDNARDMLKMMGQSATVPGAIKAKDVPEALSRLRTATESGKISPSTANQYATKPEVSMAHRGLPLVNLLAADVRAKSFVTWDKSTAQTEKVSHERNGTTGNGRTPQRPH
jgi:hypothetical protein